MGLSPLLAEANWQENTWLASAAPAASQTSAGPNLHYEVRVNDRPVDPLKEGQRLLQESDPPRREDYRVALFEARAQLEEAIRDPVASDLAAVDRR
ncbi:MAG: hypothetical protein U5L98_03115 [Halomonas sp.]|uniref:hypothetical protein n=1 Tax=Halomonas sp. TaxID=1486246 RepID=UPI002ACEAD82|nr:hypothetical protein [Halomonas sp.]MDZ7851653.1 hypothetical protein [Halomonas sp.]